MSRENRTYDELKAGDSAEIRRLCTADDFYVFAHSSGNLNPMHLPEEDGDGDGVPEAVAPSMWVASLISAVLGNLLPGPGTLYRGQELRFAGRAVAGEELVVRAEVTSKGADRLVTLRTSVTTAAGRPIVEGEAQVTAPAKKLRFDEADVPGLIVSRHAHFDAMIERAEALDPVPTAVVAPEDAVSLGGAMQAAEATLIAPLLVGDPARIAAAAEEAGISLAGIEIVAADRPRAAARAAVALVRAGKAKALMKGRLHTDELLGAVLSREDGLRAGRRLSHVFVMDVPGLGHPLLISDAAINIQPDLMTKVDIVQNAIDVARAIGIEEPKVGVLSAVETVSPRIPSTLDAAILSKMAERGQITGGLVDGPLAMDNAVDLEAARTKGIRSMVAGRAEVLIVPNLDAGNMLAKELTFIAHAEAAGIAVGARAPIILTSRADDEKARLASCAVAALFAESVARRPPH